MTRIYFSEFFSDFEIMSQLGLCARARNKFGVSLLPFGFRSTMMDSTFYFHFSSIHDWIVSCALLFRKCPTRFIQCVLHLSIRFRWRVEYVCGRSVFGCDDGSEYITLDTSPIYVYDLHVDSLAHFWCCVLCARTCVGAQLGKTALDYAKEKGKHDVTRLIEVRQRVCWII